MMEKLKAQAQKTVDTSRFSWNKDLLLDARLPSKKIKLTDAVPKLENLSEIISEEELDERCGVLVKSVTEVIFKYIRRGLFEADKLWFASELTFRILVQNDDIDADDARALLLCKPSMEDASMGPLEEWMPKSIFLKLKGLETLEAFETFTDDIMSDSDDWHDWYASEIPEEIQIPSEYDRLSDFYKLFIYRALRPDRLPRQLWEFVGSTLGISFVDEPALDAMEIYKFSSASAPIVFALSPGFDPSSKVEELAQKIGFTYENEKYCSIMMGRHQTEFAEKKNSRILKDRRYCISTMC